MKTRNQTRPFAFLLILALLLAAAPAWAAEGIKIALKSSDSGNYLGRCNNCIPGGAYPDSAFVHVKPQELESAHWAHWYIENLGGGKYALRSADSENYLSRCNNCVPKGAYSDNASVHVKPSDVKAYAHWVITRMDDGKYTLKCVDSGNYLGRCNNCVPKGAYPDSAFVHVKPSEIKGAHWAHWEVVFLP